MPGGRRVAFFGGSFDPPHQGHLAIARAARDGFALDAVLFAPVGAQPLKPEGPVARFEDRVAMTRLAIDGEAGFSVSRIDAPRPAGERLIPNYSIDTLQKLHADLDPGCTLYCLMGADSFLGLRQWHRAAEIPFVAQLIVASRPGQPLEDLSAAVPKGLALERASEEDRTSAGIEVRAFNLTNSAGARTPFFVLPGLDVPVSATEIRASIRSGRAGANAEAQGQVSAAVDRYIREHDLYRE